MQDVHLEDFEKKCFSALKSLKIVPKSYFPDVDFSNIIGIQKPTPPFTQNVKVLVEISKRELSPESISSFKNFADANEAMIYIIMGVRSKDQLGVENLSILQISGIEYFGSDEIDDLVGQASLTSEKIDEIKDYISSEFLIKCLPYLASQKIPTEITKIHSSFDAKTSITATDLFEDAVYAAFYTFNCPVEKLGKKKRFKNEPDGIVAFPAHHFAFLYECKSGEDDYKMTADDERTYVNYINSKKLQITSKYNTELKYFVLVGPKFTGKMNLRRNQIHKDSGVLLIYLSATNLKILAEWMLSFDNPEKKRAVDLQDLFSNLDKIEIDDISLSNFISGNNDTLGV